MRGYQFAIVSGCALSALLGLTALTGQSVRHAAMAQEKSEQRVFEMRTYTTHPGKLEALNARFRDHTVKLFEKHGITNVGYWVPMDGEKAQNTLIYVLAHKSKDAAAASWKAFGADPEWKTAREESEKGGKIVQKVESVFMKPVDYSAMK